MLNFQFFSTFWLHPFSAWRSLPPAPLTLLSNALTQVPEFIFQQLANVLSAQKLPNSLCLSSESFLQFARPDAEIVCGHPLQASHERPPEAVEFRHLPCRVVLKSVRPTAEKGQGPSLRDEWVWELPEVPKRSRVRGFPEMHYQLLKLLFQNHKSHSCFMNFVGCVWYKSCTVTSVKLDVAWPCGALGSNVTAFVCSGPLLVLSHMLSVLLQQ